MQYDNELIDLVTSVWSEKVYIETSEYIITGDIFMPKAGKKSRLLSEILNSKKTFLAVKNCTVESKIYPERPVKEYEFLQVNLSSILIMRSLEND